MSRSALWAVVAIVVVLALGALVHALLGEQGPAEEARPPDRPVCDVLRPDGVAPSRWFDESGKLVLSSDQVGRAALALGMQAGLDGDDPDAGLIADLLGTYVADGERGRAPSAAERAAMARLDRSVEGCPNP